jgi:hypothetical protein
MIVPLALSAVTENAGMRIDVVNEICTKADAVVFQGRGTGGMEE